MPKFFGIQLTEWLHLQAESVQQLIDSKTVAAADSALAGLKGGIGETIREIRSRCLDILAELEVSRTLGFNNWVNCTPQNPEFNTHCLEARYFSHDFAIISLGALQNSLDFVH